LDKGTDTFIVLEKEGVEAVLQLTKAKGKHYFLECG